MAGQAGENDIANAAAAEKLAGDDGVWALLAIRLQGIPTYVDLFMDAYKDIDKPSDITFVHAANAIAAFEASSWPADRNRFDEYLLGDAQALSFSEQRGMELFYGKANCVSCHSGSIYSDFDFHAIAMPQVGPGKGDGAGRHEDFGREGVTGDPSDRYKFRTPTLRNVALTAPYGHSGAYNTLDGIVRHHIDPEHALRNYNRANFVVPYRKDLAEIDFSVMDQDSVLDEIAKANELKKNRRIKERDIRDIVAFLNALTDMRSVDLRHDIPGSVPSGLPVFD